MKTQNQRILNHLQKGRKITPLQALDKFDCFRLSARINEIRNDGYPVQRDTVKTKSGKHVARYFMNTSEKPNTSNIANRDTR